MASGHRRMAPISPNALGSIYMVVGSLGYVINDGLVRKATEAGVGVYQALFIRTAMMILVLAVIAAARGEMTTRLHLRRPLMTRVAAEVVGAALFFGAIIRIEFANAQAILQLVPFAVTLAAAVLLGERVSREMYGAVLIGLVGVLVVIRPATDGFSAWSLLAVGAAAMLVVRDLATRDVSDDIPATSVALSTAVGLTALTGAITAFAGWDPVGADAAIPLCLSVGFLVTGYLFTIQTVRVGELSVSAPFRYSLLLGAVVIGYVLFDEVPDGFTIAGSVVIVVSGLWAVHIERQRSTPVGGEAGTSGSGRAG
jgi:drug/metabolite transporter (DMT)-like permease